SASGVDIGLTGSLSQSFHFTYPTYGASLSLLLPVRRHSGRADAAGPGATESHSIPSQFPGGCGATRSLHRGFAGPPPCADHRTPSLTAASRETVGAESASSSYIFRHILYLAPVPPALCLFGNRYAGTLASAKSRNS